jgi:hypothetical protein
VSANASMGRKAAGLALLLGLVATACGQPREAAAPTVSLRMHGTPIDAVVIIDDQALGTLELVMAHGVALPVGVHHVTVKADGFLPWDHEVEAKEGAGVIKLDVVLAPVPD